MDTSEAGKKGGKARWAGVSKTKRRKQMLKLVAARKAKQKGKK